MNSSRCGSCLAPIFWAGTVDGKAMPVNLEPHPDGNVRIDEADMARGRKAYVLSLDARAEAQAKGEPLYLSHFATCPRAAAHRRGRR